MNDLAIVCWKWGTVFGPEYVNRLRSSLARNLRIPHRLICVTNETNGIDPAVDCRPEPDAVDVVDAVRCRRRMIQYSSTWGASLGVDRMLAIDLDVVIVGDMTSILDRPEPIVGWRVGHAGVYSGSFLLCNVGALDGAWQEYRINRRAFLARAAAGVASDQAMINTWLRSQKPIAFWTEADGFVSYYGKGYENLERLGVGPNRRTLPAGARIVVLGSADVAVMNDRSFPWIVDHWR